MKRTAFGCTKITRLKTRLKRPLYVCWGILEGLWQLCARETPAGNIGKLSDEDIAGFLDWDGDPLELISALCDTNWLDRDPVHRLLVHDWDQHADDAVNMALARTIQLFACGSMPKLGRLSKEDRMRIEPLLLAKRTTRVQTPSESVRTPPSNTPLFDNKLADKCAHTPNVSPLNTTKVCALPCPALPLPCPATELTTAPLASCLESLVEKAKAEKKTENSNGNGHKPDVVWENWTLACNTLREVGIPEDEVRKLTHSTREELAKIGVTAPPVELFWDWLGVSYQALQKRHQGVLRGSLVGYVMSWLREALKHKPPRPPWTANLRTYEVSKNAYLRLQNST